MSDCTIVVNNCKYTFKKFDLNEHVIIEVKVSAKISDENRQQLRNYLKSAPLNNSENLKKINCFNFILLAIKLTNLIYIF